MVRHASGDAMVAQRSQRAARQPCPASAGQRALRTCRLVAAWFRTVRACPPPSAAAFHRTEVFVTPVQPTSTLPCVSSTPPLLVPASVPLAAVFATAGCAKRRCRGRPFFFALRPVPAAVQPRPAFRTVPKLSVACRRRAWGGRGEGRMWAPPRFGGVVAPNFFFFAPKNFAKKPKTSAYSGPLHCRSSHRWTRTPKRRMPRRAGRCSPVRDCMPAGRRRTLYWMAHGAGASIDQHTICYSTSRWRAGTASPASCA